MRRIWMLLPVLALTACLDFDKGDDDDDDDDDEEESEEDFGGGIGGGTGGGEGGGDEGGGDEGGGVGGDGEGGGDEGGGDAGEADASGGEGGGDDGSSGSGGTYDTELYLVLEFGGDQMTCEGQGATAVDASNEFSGSADCPLDGGLPLTVFWSGDISSSGVMNGTAVGDAGIETLEFDLTGEHYGGGFQAWFEGEQDGIAFSGELIGYQAR